MGPLEDINLSSESFESYADNDAGIMKIMKKKNGKPETKITQFFQPLITQRQITPIITFDSLDKEPPPNSAEADLHR